jgi:hypothetical protein
MKGFNHLILLVITTILIVSGCRKDDPVNAPGEFEKGILVVNQGLFQSGKGTLDFIHTDKDSVSQEIFESANGGQILGNVAQSAAVNDDFIFVALNNSAKILVADRENMKYIREISGISQPRYLIANNTNLIASAWGDGFIGSVNIYNASTGTLIHEISGLSGPEQMLQTTEGVFIPCSGGFGTDNRIFLINPQTGEKIDTFMVGDRPLSLEQAGSDIYLLCSGKFDWVDPAGNTPGGLWKWNGSDFSFVATLPNGVRELTYLPSNHSLYFLDGSMLGRLDLNSGAFNDYNIEAAVPNALSAFEINGTYQMLIADALDYVSAGKVYFVNSEGGTLKSYTTGIIPGYFVKMD